MCWCSSELSVKSSLITLVYGVNESSVISVLIHSSVSGAPETRLNVSVSFNVPRWTSIIQYRLYLHPHTHYNRSSFHLSWDDASSRAAVCSGSAEYAVAMTTSLYSAARFKTAYFSLHDNSVWHGQRGTCFKLKYVWYMLKLINV